MITAILIIAHATSKNEDFRPADLYFGTLIVDLAFIAFLVMAFTT